MNGMRLLRLVSLSVALFAVSASTAFAQAQNAETFLRDRHQAVERILSRAARTDAGRSRRQTELDSALEGLLDYDALAEAALVDHWSGLQPAQRTEFVGLLRQLVQRSYRNNLESTRDFVIRYTGTDTRGQSHIVHTTARSRTNGRAPEVGIDYELRQNGASWKVTDVVTDGVSLVRNYRSQFHRIVQRDGWDALIRRMRERSQSDRNDV